VRAVDLERKGSEGGAPRGKSAASAARETARSGGGAVTSADKRPRGRGGVVVVRFNGRTDEGKETWHDGVGRCPF
jgi:hypothetical protein